MDKRFERLLIVLMASAFVFLVLVDTSSASQNQELSSLDNQYPGILRFHVIANSDSAEDQELKLKVRDYVLMHLHDADYENAKEYIKNNLNQIETWAKEGLAQEGSTYSCTATIGVRHIPAKYYDDILFPEGNYEALTITIGEGKGQNWWCVVFPPLCLMDSGDSSYSDEFDIAESEKIQLKSKIIELMEKAESQNQNQNTLEKNSTSISSIIKGIYAYEAIDAFFLLNFVCILCERC